MLRQKTLYVLVIGSSDGRILILSPQLELTEAASYQEAARNLGFEIADSKLIPDLEPRIELYPIIVPNEVKRKSENIIRTAMEREGINLNLNGRGEFYLMSAEQVEQLRETRALIRRPFSFSSIFSRN